MTPGEAGMEPIRSPEVAAVFEDYPAPIRRRLLALRALILETARSIEGVGEVEETLKWGEPSYVTSDSGSGTTIRLSWRSAAPDEYAMCFHCQTTLIGDFRLRFPHELRFDGNRRIVFAKGERLPRGVVKECVAAALTYHWAKAARRRVR